MDLRNSISYSVLKLRNEKGYTQKELASRIGISRTYLSSVERCRVDMRISILEKLAKAFDMSAVDFLNVSEEYYSKESNIAFNPSIVQIGNQLWMTENLKYDDGVDGIIYNPDNKEYYYTWDAANRVVKKLGWKLPSVEDWNRAAEECRDVCTNPENGFGFRDYEGGKS